MTVVAVLGGGAGGAAAAVELTLAGHSVRLWNRRASTVEPHRFAGGIEYTGVLGEGFCPVPSIGTDLAAALQGADLAVVCLPALAHEALFADLATLGTRLPLVLNPGHTGGALHARAVFASVGIDAPPIVEFSTLTYVARKNAASVVSITGTAGRVAMALLGDDHSAIALAAALWPGAVEVSDVLATSLSNVNLVLHPPAAILGAAWVEATGGAFRYYADGTTPGVAAVMAALDAERRAVASAYGHDLPPLLDEMLAIGTVEPFDGDPGDAATIREAVASGVANSAILAPASLAHRYYQEDFAFGVVPFIALADAAGVPVPTASALLVLADTMLAGTATRDGLTLDRLGLETPTRSGILAAVRQTEAVS